MDSETGCVDNLFEKPRVDGRRALGKNTRSGSSGFNPTVTKVVKGDAVSKVEFSFQIIRILYSFQNRAKSMSNSILEELSPEVPYSLKKKNRWENLNDVDSALNSAVKGSPLFNVSAVEMSSKGHSSRIVQDNEIQVYGRIKAGSDRAEKISTKGGRGAPLLSLEDSLEWKKGNKNKKEKSEEEEVKPREPEVTLIIDPKGNTQVISAGSLEEQEVLCKGTKNTQRSNKFGDKLLGEEIEEAMEETNEEHEELEDEHNQEVDTEVGEKLKDFQLSDFIKSAPQKKQRIHPKKVQKAESLDEISPECLAPKNHEKPTNEYEVLQNTSFFSKDVDAYCFFLKPEFAIPKLQEWISTYGSSDMIWMNARQSKCLVDFSKFLKSRNPAAIVGFTVLEDTRHLRLTFNTDFPFTFSEKNFQKFSENDKNYYEFFKCIHSYLMDAAEQVFVRIKRFEPYQDTFKCLFNNIVYPLKEYDIVKKFSNLTEVHNSGFISTSCAFNNCNNSEDLFNFSCLHSFCFSCARSTFETQILKHSDELTCPICSSVQDPIKLAFVLPIAMIRKFIKDKFSRLCKNGIGKCLKCCGYFERIPGASSVSCDTCQIVFCQDCSLPPHFPISCDQMKDWFPKLEYQCKLELSTA